MITQIQENKKYRAIAKEKDGIVMYWVEELGEGGLHIRGLAKLLGCEQKTVQNMIKGDVDISVLEAEVVTDRGLQVTKLMLGQDIAKLLRYISRSKCKAETRDRADDIRDQLAAAGFKLAVMLELAPQQLLAQVEAAQPKVLPSSVNDYLDLIKTFDLSDDPLIKSLITQRLAEELGSKSIAPALTTEVILTVRASELGYDQKQIGNGSQLGTFVPKLIQPKGKTQHGKYPVNVYELTPELDDCIHAYFGNRAGAV